MGGALKKIRTRKHMLLSERPFKRAGTFGCLSCGLERGLGRIWRCPISPRMSLDGEVCCCGGGGEAAFSKVSLAAWIYFKCKIQGFFSWVNASP